MVDEFPDHISMGIPHCHFIVFALTWAIGVSFLRARYIPNSDLPVLATRKYVILLVLVDVVHVPGDSKDGGVVI